MNTVKLFLYDSTQPDGKGTDYSSYVLSGNQYIDDLTEILDVCNLTLAGLPFSEEFDPTTKFILETYEDGLLVDTFDLCVANDVVTQPILSDDNYYNHSITFNEASVLAQGRIVDNCSETYELKEVSLNVAPSYSEEERLNLIQRNTQPAVSQNNGETITGVGTSYVTHTFNLAKKFRFVWGSEYGLSGSRTDWETQKRNVAISGASETITLPIPLIAMNNGVENSTAFDSHDNFCAVKTTIYRKNRISGSWEVDTTQANNPLITKPSTSNSTENDWQLDFYLASKNPNVNAAKGYATNRVPCVGDVYNAGFWCYYKKFTDFDSSVQNRTLSIEIIPNYDYMIIITLNDTTTSNLTLDGGGANDNDAQFSYKGSSNYIDLPDTGALYPTFGNFDYLTNDKNASDYEMSQIENNPVFMTTISAYAASQSGEVIFKSAPPLSAYDLFIDAQLKSQMLWKTRNTYIKDSTLTYYMEDSDIEKLKNTQIVESSFNQKNFWEILLEIGKYIHAIPYIKFGDNNRLLVTWRELGSTEQYQYSTTTISIFNSRSIENYIGALNSYITNAIQLGGEVEEWLVPKTEAETYTVCNDNAVLITSKPIMEIISLTCRCITANATNSVGDEAVLTPYIFEDSIYQLLDITGEYATNKGFAIYYNLGENVIRGLNYQLPSVSVGDEITEYAIKRILGKAFSMATSDWKDILVNCYEFKIVYRTKESIRSEQSRPDLRKYLINNAYEEIPQHKQFNNQQDISVDSVKLGNQVYGKLIKTGNTEYQTTEWVDTPSQLKKAGQLTYIRGNIYYISKAINTYFQDHILSEITYSKDYNQLSEIIGIPSEPRFFEISERNIIDRYKNINAYLSLGTSTLTGTNNLIYGTQGFTKIKDILFGNATYPKYVITQIKNDENNPSLLSGISSFKKTLIHSLSAYSMRNTLSFKWGMEDNFSAGVQTKLTNSGLATNQAYYQLLPFPYVDKYGRADLMEFMIFDNLIFQNNGVEVRDFPDSPYRVVNRDLGTNRGKAVKYSVLGIAPVDINPRVLPLIAISSNGYIRFEDGTQISSDSEDNFFYVQDDDVGAIYVSNGSRTWIRRNLQNNPDWTDLLKPNIPSSMLNTLRFSSRFDDPSFGDNDHGIALIKDNREKLMFNFNIQMLTDSDRFVLSGYMWQQNKQGNIKLATLNKEVNKIINDTILQEDVINTYSLTTTAHTNRIEINIANALNGVDLTNVKAIAIISDSIPQIGYKNQYNFIAARNISDLDDAGKKQNWFISIPSDDFFKKQ